MAITFHAIQPLWDELPLQTAHTEDGSASAAGGGMQLFSDVFQNTINTVRETDAEKNQAEYLLATGQLDNPATLSVASSQAQLAVELLVQLRNRALDAYSEVTRISI